MSARTFARFGMVGGIGFFVDVGVLYALADGLGWYGARAISFLCAVVVTWLLNRHLTFKGRSGSTPAWHEFLAYLLSMLGGGTVNYLVYMAVLYCVDGIHAPMIAVAAGSIAGLSINYLLARDFIFKPRSHH